MAGAATRGERKVHPIAVGAISDRGELFRGIGQRKKSEFESAGIRSIFFAAYQVELEREIIGKTGDEFGEKDALFGHGQPFAVATFDGLYLAGAVGIPLIGKIADGVLGEVFDDEDLVAGNEIEFAICFEVGGSGGYGCPGGRSGGRHCSSGLEAGDGFGGIGLSGFGLFREEFVYQVI